MDAIAGADWGGGIFTMFTIYVILYLGSILTIVLVAYFLQLFLAQLTIAVFRGSEKQVPGTLGYFLASELSWAMVLTVLIPLVTGTFHMFFREFPRGNLPLSAFELLALSFSFWRYDMEKQVVTPLRLRRITGNTLVFSIIIILVKSLLVPSGYQLSFYEIPVMIMLGQFFSYMPVLTAMLFVLWFSQRRQTSTGVTENISHIK